MSDIQRYTNLINGDEVVRNDNGHLVKYKDHIKAIEAKDKEIESLKGQLKDCRCLLEYKRDDIRIRDEDIGNLADEVRRFKKIAHLCSDMVALSPAPKKGYAHIEELAELQNKINELAK